MSLFSVNSPNSCCSLFDGIQLQVLLCSLPPVPSGCLILPLREHAVPILVPTTMKGSAGSGTRAASRWCVLVLVMESAVKTGVSVWRRCKKQVTKGRRGYNLIIVDMFPESLTLLIFFNWLYISLTALIHNPNNSTFTIIRRSLTGTNCSACALMNIFKLIPILFM